MIENPVSRLSKNQMWYRKRRRQGVIPDHKLADWYRAVMATQSEQVREYLLLLIMTGLRRNEAATLRWRDVDFEARTLRIREDIAKNHREHKLRLSDFLLTLLSRRKQGFGDCEYVFPGRHNGHMVLLPGVQGELPGNHLRGGAGGVP
jgi:integrase